MANFSLVVNSKFNPFSFERYIQPYQIYGQAYREVENTLGELDTKASVWEKMANEQADPDVYKMYKTYANDLKEKAGQLAREGLNAASRRDMLNMRSRYSKEIVPIEQAYTTRQKQAEQQQQALLQDPTLMFSRRASTTRLSDYIRNPQLAYESYSGKLITAQVASAAAALTKEMQEEPRKWRSILGDSYYESMMQKGVSSDMISRFLNNADSIIYDGANPEQFGVPVEVSNKLRGLLEAPLASTKIRSWESGMSKADWKDIVTQVNNHARQGLWSAVGETQYQTLDNWRAKMDAQEAMQIRAEERVAAREAEKNQYKINPLPLRSPQEISKKNKQIKDFIDKGYLKRTANGLTLTNTGQQQLRSANFKPIVQTWEQYKKANPGASRSSYGDMVARVERMGNRLNVFSTWYNGNVGGYNPRTGKVETPTTRLNRYENSIKADSYDIYHTTEYDRQLDSEYGKEYMTQMWSAAETEDDEKVLYGVEFGGKKGWSKTKAYTKKDLEGYTVSNIRHFKNGDTAILQSTQKGKHDIIRIQIPRGMNIGAEANVRSAITNADYWGSVLSEGRQPVITANGEIATDANGNIIYSNTPLTEADKVVLKKKQNRALQDIYGYGSQTVVPSQTNNEQINPWY